MKKAGNITNLKTNRVGTGYISIDKFLKKAEGGKEHAGSSRTNSITNLCLEAGSKPGTYRMAKKKGRPGPFRASPQ